MTVAMQPSETMGCRFGLCDLRRTATSVVLSPDHRLAAVSDSLGRVLLVDAFRGLTLRIFKGYRHAQCAFIPVPDERHSKHRQGNKVAMFLVIYSPKKGTVEIFTVQQGQRITTFSASKHSKLIYNNYGLMGFTTTSKSRFICQFDTVLIDGDGQIKDISIPFHFALGEKNNARARDIHLFKKVKQILKLGGDEVEIERICRELKTEEVKLQTLELLICDKDLGVDVLLRCVQILGEGDNLGVADNARAILDFYVWTLSEVSDTSSSSVKLDTKQCDNLQKLLDLSATSVRNDCKVSFAESETPSPAEFLSAFNLTKSDINLKQNLDDSLLHRVSRQIFHKRGPGTEQIVAARVPVKDLFGLLIHFWVHHTLVDVQTEMNNLLSVVHNLVKPGVDSRFWAHIREVLAKAPPFPALTAAILCKLAEEFEASSVDDDIEILSQESIEWTLLIGKLEDVSLLSIVLSNKPKPSTLPKLKYKAIDVTLMDVLDKGRGSVSELVARWLCFSGIDPQNIVLNDALAKKCEHEEAQDDDDVPEQDIMPDKIQEIEKEQVFQHLNLLKTQFPYSLEAGVLLANMCWEYAMDWQKHLENLDIFEAAIKCLVHITDSHIREGLFNLVWNTHLKILFEGTSKLVNKVGKLPKERLCKQDTGLSDYQLVLFLATTTNFLDAYMDAVQQSFGVGKPVLQFEGIWDCGPQALVELALQQNPINYDLLHLHYQLSLTLQMLTTFSIKHSKPLNNLFESYTFSLFFADFQNPAQINWNYTDAKVQASRTQFLCKVVSASLETVTVNEGKIYASEHVKWMVKCQDIARLWNLDLDILRRFELVQMYVSGFDSFGDELFGCVQDKNKLGPELLAVAGKRLSQFLTTDASLCQNVAALSTVVTRYMEQLNGDWCAPSDLAGIENLANRSLSCMDEDQSEHKVAELLLDGCHMLQKIHKSNV